MSRRTFMRGSGEKAVFGGLLLRGVLLLVVLPEGFSTARRWPVRNSGDVVSLWLHWWNTGDTAIAHRIYAPDYRRNATDMSESGPGPVKRLVAMYRAAFPDLHFEVEGMVSEGDTVAVRWVAAGTHQAPLLGLPATNRHVSLIGCDVLRLRGDLIAESWSYYDRLALMEQLQATT